MPRRLEAGVVMDRVMDNDRSLTGRFDGLAAIMDGMMRNMNVDEAARDGEADSRIDGYEPESGAGAVDVESD